MLNPETLTEATIVNYYNRCIQWKWNTRYGWTLHSFAFCLSLFICLTCEISSHSPCNLICACVVCMSVHCSLLVCCAYCTCMSVRFTVHFCSERWLLPFPSSQSLCHGLSQVFSRRASECNLAASYTRLCICSFVFSVPSRSPTSFLHLQYEKCWSTCMLKTGRVRVW